MSRGQRGWRRCRDCLARCTSYVGDRVVVLWYGGYVVTWNAAYRCPLRVSLPIACCSLQVVNVVQDARETVGNCYSIVRDSNTPRAATSGRATSALPTCNPVQRWSRVQALHDTYVLPDSICLASSLNSNIGSNQKCLCYKRPVNTGHSTPTAGHPKQRLTSELSLAYCLH